MVRIRVLGALEAHGPGGALELGGPRPRAVLALLLARRGGVVPVDRLIEDLWGGEPPPRAIASLQAYVSNLRRLLEPERPARAPARVLVSAAPGYALRLPVEAVDGWRFEAAVDRARAVRDDDPAAAADLLDGALAQWRGPAFAEFADAPWAATEVARLDELRLQALELLAATRLDAGQAARAVPTAQLLTATEPLREEGWRLLAVALCTAGRQGDALAALRQARAVLAGELGVDPGPALLQLESDVLAQRVGGRPDRSGTSPAPAEVRAPPDADPFVGRERELAALHAAADRVRAGASAVVLVSGEAGGGKSRLLAHWLAGLAPARWWIGVGRCPESDGAPPAWAWLEALRPLAAQVPPGERAVALAPLLADDAPRDDALARSRDAAGGRFRLHRAVCGWLRAAAGTRPLLLLLDDLHRADGETLALLAAVAADLVDVPVLLAVAFRAGELPASADAAMAAVARRSPVRLPLRGLTPDEVGRMLAAGPTPVDAATVEAIAARTDGNPFYVRESARLLASEGALVATSQVPDGVRDVLRRRLARLPEASVAVLRLAAVQGRDVDVDVLLAAADHDEDTALDALESCVIAGLLTQPAPGRLRFVHAIVRDTVYADLAPLRRGRMHARIAEALARHHPQDHSALAHHYARAGTAATAARAVRASIAAAELAERRYAHDTAIAVLEQAMECLDRVPSGDRDPDAERVELLGRLLRAQARAGSLTTARQTRQRALDVAAAAGRDDLALVALTAWTVPSPWDTHPYAWIDVPVVELAGRLLRRTDLAPDLRARLLDTLSAELDESDPRAAEAAAELTALAERTGDTVHRAMALNARARHLHLERDHVERGRVGAELIALGTGHDLPSYRWAGHHVSAMAAAARTDLPALHEHVDAIHELAVTHHLAEPLAVAGSARAMIAVTQGRLDDAERGYRQVVAMMERQGSLHAQTFSRVARIAVRMNAGRTPDILDDARELHQVLPQLTVDLLVVALAATGDTDVARAAWAHRPRLRTDYYGSVYVTLRGMAAAALGDRSVAAATLAELMPLRGVVAGAATVSLVLGPVAQVMGDLALLLDRPGQARELYREALEVARRWGAPQWRQRAEAALRALAARAGVSSKS